MGRKKVQKFMNPVGVKYSAPMFVRRRRRTLYGSDEAPHHEILHSPLFTLHPSPFTLHSSPFTINYSLFCHRHCSRLHDIPGGEFVKIYSVRKVVRATLAAVCAAIFRNSSAPLFAPDIFIFVQRLFFHFRSPSP
jgi:hypothetical protein